MQTPSTNDDPGVQSLVTPSRTLTEPIQNSLSTYITVTQHNNTVQTANVTFSKNKPPKNKNKAFKSQH